jgi:hypothetical protein
LQFLFLYLPQKINLTNPKPGYTAEQGVTLYRIKLIAGWLPFTIDDVRRELKGKDLICWRRPGAPCHADVLTFIPKGNANPSR